MRPKMAPLVAIAAGLASLLAGPAVCAVQAKEADYVIVGGGTAGCALAARLCEGLPDARVVVLERGMPRSEEQEMSVRAIRLSFSYNDDPEIVEAFSTEPNEALYGRELEVLSGATLGGTSVLSGAQFSRPEASVVAGWGLTGLDEAAVEKLYARVKTQLQAGPQPETLKMAYLDEWLEANALAGVPVLDSSTPKGESEDGVWEANSMVDDQGRRQDSAYAYLRPVMDGVCSGNLEVVQGATVSKILFEGSTAVGVQYLVGNDSSAEPQVVMAAQEVVLAAGPYNSPKLLMLSGIGPAEELDDLGIPLVADLPVGQQAQERIVVPFVYLYGGMPEPPEAIQDVVLSEDAAAMFMAGEGGPLGTQAAMATGVWAPPLSVWRAGFMMPLDITGESPANFALSACDMNPDPLSRATITLNSTNVFDVPLVDTNLAAQPEEIARIVMCYDAERAVVEGLNELGFNTTEILPGEDADLEDMARASTNNAGNMVGSCGIDRVLDADLRVLGFDNLMVVDSSAIPDIPYNSGPMATTYLLAEYAAESLIAAHMNGGDLVGGGGYGES